MMTNSGIVLRWRWKAAGGFDKFLDRNTYDNELEEAFLTCLDIGERAFSFYPKGIELFPEDRELVEKKNISLSGGSLALAFLLGMLAYIKNKQWPKGVVAWGCIRPDRRNSFTLHAVDRVDQKIELAKIMDAGVIIHSDSERKIETASIREIRITASIAEAVSRLESFIQGKDM